MERSSTWNWIKNIDHASKSNVYSDIKIIFNLLKIDVVRYTEKSAKSFIHKGVADFASKLEIKTTWQAFCQNYWNWWKNNDIDDILQKENKSLGRRHYD